jgi:phosphatidate cytidylyltransferase
LLRARILTAAVMLGVFLLALFSLAPWQFALVVGAIAAIAAHEWAGLCGFKGLPKWSYASGAVLLFAAFALSWPASEAAWWVLGASAAFWLIIVPVWLYRGITQGARRWLPPVGLLVIVPTAGAMLALSPLQLLAALAIAWVADTAAYFAGRAWGRHKLAPAISPGKTMEGAAAALVAVAIYAAICASLMPELEPVARGAGWAVLLAVALLLAVLSILGDLFESAVKRVAGVKDSGSILPGHGGILDRIDSATSTLPLVALLFQWMRLQ